MAERRNPDWEALGASPDFQALFTSERVAVEVSHRRKVLEAPSELERTDLEAIGRARGFLEAVEFLRVAPERELEARMRRRSEPEAETPRESRIACLLSSLRGGDDVRLPT